jgi:hypothetical protein
VTFGGVFLGAMFREYAKKSMTEDWRAVFKLIKMS